MPHKDPAKQARRDRRHRQRHADRLASGVCTRCARLPPELGLKVCRSCAEKRRAAEKARRAKARQQGKPYSGRDPERCRHADRAADRLRRRARRDAGLCTSCGLRRPEDNHSACEPCRGARRALDRRRYAARRAAGLCTRCAQPAVGGSSRCGRCSALEAERTSPVRRSTAGKKRYARRRARGLCVDCAAPSAGSARCQRCAYRSNVRAPAREGFPDWHRPYYTVIDPDRGELGTFETEAEAAACIAFARLRPQQVEIRSNVPLMALHFHHE